MSRRAGVWGHRVYALNSYVLLIRAEPTRVLSGFCRGQRLRALEPRLKPGGRCEMATLVLQEDTKITATHIAALARAAADLDRTLGDPTALAPKPASRKR